MICAECGQNETVSIRMKVGGEELTFRRCALRSERVGRRSRSAQPRPRARARPQLAVILREPIPEGVAQA